MQNTNEQFQNSAYKNPQHKTQLPLPQIEKGIIKRFRRHLWSPFIKAIKDYQLIKDGDNIAIAISGGKDSLILAKLFQELYKHGIKNFSLKFIVMNPGFNEKNLNELIENCKHLNIPINIFNKKVFDTVEKISEKYPCYMCARIRRGALYAYAQELGCNKIALGHHFDDVIETVLLNVLCAGTYMTMMPKLKSTNFDNMELIRPLYYIREEHIQKFFKWAGITPLACDCPVSSKQTSSKRTEIKKLIANLSENFDDVEKSIFHSTRNVHLDAILEWKSDDIRHNFLDSYDIDITD